MQVLPALAFFALAFFALALAESGQSVAKALQNIASGIPLLGSAIGSLFGKLAQALAWAAGQLYQGIDAMMGAVFHALAWVLEQTFAMYREQAIALLHLSQWAAGQVSGVPGLRSLVRQQAQELRGIEHGVKTLNREVKSIDEQIRDINGVLAKLHFKGIDATLTNLQDQINTVEHKTIPAIQGQVGTLDDALGNVEGYLNLPTTLPRVDWLAGVVAVALGALGLGGLGCGNFKNLFSKFGCGLGTLLNDLLGLMIAGLFLESVCEFLPQFEAAFGAVVGPITELLTNTPLGNCEQVPASWSHLDVAAGPIPPPQSLGTFPH